MKNKERVKFSALAMSAKVNEINSLKETLNTIQKAKSEAVLPPKRNPFGMVKTAVTEERKNRIFSSIQHIAVMTEIIKIEYCQEMDVQFRDPYLNNLATRIGNDCLDLASRISKGPLVQFTSKDADFSEDYAIELHRVFKLFIGMEIEKIAELMDGWEAIAEKVENAGDLNYITMGFTPEELEEVGRLIKRKGISDSLKTKFEAVIKESLK